MDKEKFEKMFEMMKGCWTDEKGMANCCSIMMKKMMQWGKGKEAEKKKETETGQAKYFRNYREEREIDFL